MWLSSESCSSSMESLLPLVFHPCPSMRREIAVLLAFMLFSSDVLISSLEELGTSRDRQLKSNFTTLLAATSPKDPKCLCDFELFVPLPFLHSYRFPCKVVGVKLCHSGNQCLDFPVDDELVCRMVTQMQLLEGGTSNLLKSLQKKLEGDHQHISPLPSFLELQAHACLSVLNTDIIIKKLLTHLLCPKGFEEELQLLDDLESQCARHPEALKILLKSCWMPPFHRILKTPKSIPETLRVLKVIRLGQMMLTSKAVCSSTISFLAIAYKESLLPLLAKGMHKSLKSNLITRSFTLSFFVCGWTLG
jgi:hypothetical protein